jgi:CDP-glucose 4,6-dehydratase
VVGRQGILEKLAVNQSDAWLGKRVFLTGHTGFKGTWLTHLLLGKGAKVFGYALSPQTVPNMFDLTGTADKLNDHHLGDVRDAETLKTAMRASKPDVVIHMAAQPFVRRSYKDPAETWSSNVMGTVNCLEAVRGCPEVAAVLIVTTDKCYANNDWHWGYRETDALGGHDPYSASKAAAELVAQSYRKSFFENGPLIATARAGNVIGGGDWSEDRLIPDIVRAVTAGSKISIRSPQATRPWQHVLDCLNGYLLLCEQLMQNRKAFATGYNFGPDAKSNVTVHEILTQVSRQWNSVQWEIVPQSESAVHEARFLYLDSSKAHNELNWRSHWSLEQALAATAEWYRVVLGDNGAAYDLTQKQIDQHAKASTFP